MKEFADNPARFNDSEEHVLEGLERPQYDAVLMAISTLQNVPWTATTLSTEEVEAAELVVSHHNAGHLALSTKPFTFTSAVRFPEPVITFFLAKCTFARSAWYALDANDVGAFTRRPKNVDDRKRSRRFLRSLIASLSMSVVGLSRIEQLPPEVVKAWLGIYKDASGNRWNDDLWGTAGDIAYQCLREISYAYARLTGDQSVAGMTKQKRSDSTSVAYWADMPTQPDPVRSWFAMYRAWRAIRPTASKSYRQMFMHLARWLTESPEQPGETNVVLQFMSQPRSGSSFTDYMLCRLDEAAAAGSEPKAGRSSVSGDFVVDTLSMASRFSEFVTNELATNAPVIKFLPLVTVNDLARAKTKVTGLGRSGPGAEVVSRPLPARYYKLVREILEEGENGWPGSCSLCIETIGESKVYCPVLPTLFLSLFHLPLRVGQAKRLDSGEGDIGRFDGKKLVWGANEGANAGYWFKAGCREEARGYAFMFDGDPPITGFFINTNKTGSPFRVPWQNEALHVLFYELREWQERWNPAVGPIGPELYVDGIDRAEEGKLADYPYIFALFRLPVDPRSGRQGVPPNARRTNEFWQHLMAELERRWNESHPGEAAISIVKRQEKTGQPYGAYYNAHGMRVAGLTLMLHQKIPIEIISKLIAGHATIIMTLKYMKLDPSAIHEALERAKDYYGNALTTMHMRDLKVASLQEARDRSACVTDDGLLAAIAMPAQDKVLWADTGIGFCPYDGARCNDGGARIRKSTRPGGKSNDVFQAVEGGPRNCILCRHFVSGPAWRIPLWLYGNTLCRRIAEKSKRIGDLEKQLEQLRMPDAAKPGRSRGAAGQIQQSEVELDALRIEQELLGKALWNTISLLEACDDIERRTKDERETGTNALAPAPKNGRSLSFAEGSEFIQAAIVTAAGQLHPVLYDAAAEATRNRFLDAIIWHSGGRPLSMSTMDPAALERSRDEMTRFLLQRVSHDQADALANGAITLQDLGMDGEASTRLPDAFLPSMTARVIKPSSSIGRAA